MCGIAGLIAPGVGPSQSPLPAMLKTIAHRGPDGEGTWFDAESGTALGHRRLSILDLTDCGAQPMKSRSGRFMITFNGEIYNFQQLRQKLLKVGAQFKGSGDTEVMLAAFEQWGVEESLKQFVGMFAFALWDKELKSLTLARDRVGEKPLYYGWTSQGFVFASELKAIKAIPNLGLNLNRDAIATFLRFNCIQGPLSIYQEIFKLTAGTSLTIPASLAGKKPAEFDADPDSATGFCPQRYWSARKVCVAGLDNPILSSIEDTVESLDSVLFEAVRGQMISDVPLGAFLSGGIDSSTIVAMMQRASSRPVKTFSIGFHEKEFDEAKYAKQVAKHLGTDHTELYVTPQASLDLIPQLPYLYDEPFSDSSQIPTHLVARLARQSVTVSLSGDGGDELFGGYNRYIWTNKIWNIMRALGSHSRGTIARVIQSVSPEHWDTLLKLLTSVIPFVPRIPHFGMKFHKISQSLQAKNSKEFYIDIVAHWANTESLVLSDRPVNASVPIDREAPQTGFINDMMYLDLISYLPADILVKVDRAAMAVSLETRAPFLDHRVVEFAWRLPPQWKINKGVGKWILRKVLDKYVPRHLVERPKMGFGVPIGAWLRGPLRGWAEELLSETRLKRDGILNPIRVRERWKQHLNGTGNWQYKLWDVLMLQAWIDAQR